MYRARWKIMKALCKSLGNGSTYFAACQAAGITQMSFWRWRRTVRNKKGKTFDSVVQDIWDKRVGTVEDAVYISAIKGNAKSQETFLNNRARNRWRKDPDTVVHIGDDNSKHLTQIFQAAPERIIFDDGDGDRATGLHPEEVPEGCDVTPPDVLEVPQECQENRLP